MSQLNFLFLSTLMAILIWMSSSSVKANSQPEIAAPKAFEARYAINWHGIEAGETVHRLIRRESNVYHFETRSEPHLRLLPFHYVESSDFKWQDGKIIPQRFSYNIREGKKHRRGHLIFDWQTHKLCNRSIKPQWEAELPDDIQDRLTQTFAARAALKAGAKAFVCTVAEEDKMKIHTFRVLGAEHLATKLGNIETIKIENISRKGHHTKLWLATRYDYLPVKMTQFRQGKLVASGVILSYHEDEDQV